MSLLEVKASLSIFEGLKSYSRTDVELINVFSNMFGSAADWGLWIQEGLGAMLEVAGERVVLLQQTNQIEPADTKHLKFQKDEINIGREQDNDIVVPLAGLGRHHARITKQNARYFVEDLGSANGTYLNGERLDPHTPAPLDEGARFLIFPHQFTFSNRPAWSTQPPIKFAGGAAEAVTWNSRRSSGFGGTQLFSVKVSPGIGFALLGVSQEFLKALVHRTSRAEVQRLIPADNGLFEFLLVSVLERASRELNFPFRLSLAPFEEPLEDERGVSVECVIGLTGAIGTVELFLPGSLLREVRRFQCDERLLGTAVAWPVLLSTGYSDLSLDEWAGLETGDVLLIVPAHNLLLPSTPAREQGWRAVLVEADPPQLRIEDYFERGDFIMESRRETSEQSDLQKPDLRALPVRVHIVLSQLEMTLAELNRLGSGSVIELDRDKSDSVQLAVNGKIAGTGELVEVEGRLGVRISNWTAQ